MVVMMVLFIRQSFVAPLTKALCTFPPNVTNGLEERAPVCLIRSPVGGLF